MVDLTTEGWLSAMEGGRLNMRVVYPKRKEVVSEQKRAIRTRGGRIRTKGCAIRTRGGRIRTKGCAIRTRGGRIRTKGCAIRT
ncbi:hypothetical protein, partial [Lysinibacillus sp. 54212]|uniref:hypothetical protein n=1 Tax=Lysinibacillus sp. 54212 TaxID=3119829 RepID=UPI002FCB1CF9